MNHKLFSILLLSVFLIISVESTFAQNGLKGRNNIKASHSRYIFRGAHFFQLEYNSGLTKFIEAGAYLATNPDFYLLQVINPTTNEPFIIGLDSRAYNYGIQTNIHPLQLLIKDGHRFRLDLYFNAKIGGRYSPVPADALPQKENYFFYDIGGGLAYHFYKHWGVFMEYNYRSPAKFRYGLSIKF
ncbi:hypothetical protein SAMN05661096_03088 [Marivirga sericea]|uniref:Outer membrane protein beta-barrel domain-containing protein n=1 Tax=Marivirga sericea TaxID=1028 RepID=A0A1X7KRH1_9BACT|nr:hypothetical protein [Marivirga sericea]SMG44024.1 hypothetical protein SAMN05661096_03088 [Marivirga sericea]